MPARKISIALFTRESQEVSVTGREAAVGSSRDSGPGLWRGFFILSALVLATFLLSTAPLQAESAPETVYLKSRTVTPSSLPEAQATLQNTPASRWHGLVQLAEPPNDAQRQALTQAGVELLGYIPQNTWLATLPADLNGVQDLSFVSWIGSLMPEDKVEPALHDGNVGEWALNEDGSINLWIDVFADVAPQDAAALIAAHGGTVSQILPEYRRLYVTTPANALWALAAEDALQWIAQAPPPQQALADGSRAIIEADAVQTTPYELGGYGVQAGIWDTGVADANHPDFAGRLTIVDTHASTQNHATHVTGILGGDGSNSANHGGSHGQWRGIAPGVQLFSFYWDGPTLDHDKAINEHGIDLSQNSWSLGGCSSAGDYNSYAADYDRIANGLYGRRIPIVFAAGNMRQNCSEPYGTVHGGPQSAKNILTVGGISSNDGSMMNMSSWGPVDDGRLKPEVVAAGQTEAGSGIYSTYAGGGYGSYTGTSMAAPAVSGSMALILEQHHSICPQNGDSQGNPLPSTTKALLIHGADDLDDASTSYMNPGPDFSSGYGSINDRRSVDLVGNYVESAIDHAATDDYQIQITSQASLKVTLVWDDVPAEANAALTLVNDLDLEVLAPDGTTVYGPWILNTSEGQEGQPAQRHTWTAGEPGGRDTINVVEQVLVDDPAAGTWTIRVTGSNVPVGPQPYSIVSEELQNDNCKSETTPTAVTLLGTSTQNVDRPMPVVALFIALNSLGLATLVVRVGRND